MKEEIRRRTTFVIQYDDDTDFDNTMGINLLELLNCLPDGARAKEEALDLLREVKRKRETQRQQFCRQFVIHNTHPDSGAEWDIAEKAWSEKPPHL